MKFNQRTISLIIMMVGITLINSGIIMISLEGSLKNNNTLSNVNEIVKLNVPTTLFKKVSLSSVDKKINYSFLTENNYKARNIFEGTSLESKDIKVEVLVRPSRKIGDSYNYINRQINTFYKDTKIVVKELEVNNRKFNYTLLADSNKFTYVFASDIDENYVYVVKASSSNLFDVDDISNFLVVQTEKVSR